MYKEDQGRTGGIIYDMVLVSMKRRRGRPIWIEGSSQQGFHGK